MNELQLYHPYGFIISPLYNYLCFTLYGIAIFCGILLVVYSVYILKKWYTQSRNTPWHYALQRIELLDKNSALQAKEFYFETSDIIKYYCTQRFDRSYEALSDKEMVSALKNSNVCSAELCDQLENILTLMHTIKFYTQQEQAEHRQVILDYIRFFINTTIPT